MIIMPEPSSKKLFQSGSFEETVPPTAERITFASDGNRFYLQPSTHKKTGRGPEFLGSKRRLANVLKA
jgi:hypothetical protein